MLSLKNEYDIANSLSLYAVDKEDRDFTYSISESQFTISKETTEQFLSSIVKRELKLGYPRPEFDESISDWFEFKNVELRCTKIKNACVLTYTLLKPITDSQFFEIVSNTDADIFGGWLSALAAIRQAILNGKVDTRNASLMAYFFFPEGKGYAPAYYFQANRFGDQLKVSWCVSSPDICLEKNIKVLVTRNGI